MQHFLQKCCIFLFTNSISDIHSETLPLKKNFLSDFLKNGFFHDFYYLFSFHHFFGMTAP